MKRYSLFALLVTAAMLTGCGEQEFSRADHTPPEIGNANGDTQVLTPPDGLEGAYTAVVYARTEQEIYPPDVSEIKLHIVNPTDAAYYLPESFSLSCYLQTESGFEYVPLSYRDQGDSFTEMALEVPANGETDMTLNLAAHYDLPLDIADSSQFRIQIGELSADFIISEDGAMPVQPQEQMIMEAEQESYPAGTKEITVRLINAGDSDYTFTNEDFGIEQFGDGFVSMTPFSKDSPAAQNGMTLAPDACEMWTLTLSDFSGLELQTGEYAVYLAGIEARFTVT